MSHAPLPTSPTGKSKPWYVRWWAIVLFVGFALIVISAVGQLVVAGIESTSTGVPTRSAPAATPTERGTTDSGAGVLTREELGDQWPLTVDQIAFICEEPMRLLGEAEGTVYTLNGAAKAAHPDRPNVREIQRKDPVYDDLLMNAGPVLDAGLAYCGWE